MIPITHQEFSARKWPLLLIFGPLGAFLFTLKPEENKSNFSIDFVLTGFILIIAIFYFVLTKLRITIDNEGLEMKMLFKTETVSWNEITKSNLSFEFHGHTGDVKWVFERFPKKTFSFSPTFFSRKDLQQIAEALVSKKPNAHISEKVRRMSKGKFPWYIF